MGNQEEKQLEVKGSMLTLIPEKEKGKNIFDGKADVDKSSAREEVEVVEIMTRNLNIKDLSIEQRRLMSDNFNRRMTPMAIHIREELKRQSDARNKRIINDGPSK